MNKATIHKVGVIMNGVTGRMGTNQHFIRSVLAIRKQGGIEVRDNEFIMPEPMLVGRNETKLRELAAMGEGIRWTTDLDAALASPEFSVYFDAQTTGRRPDGVKKAVAAGKHVYCEKPTAVSTEQALELYEVATRAGVKNGVVQDKLWLVSFVKLRRLIEEGFFGRILSVRGEFGYWVFTGHEVAPQRPSWNYRKEDDGGIIVDMLCHWQYILENLFGAPKGLFCLGATHIPERMDEAKKPYTCTADDAAYTTFELEGGVIAHFNSSWATRVRRDDLLTIQVDGERGSAVAGLRDVWTQHAGNTPRPTWNPDIPQPINFYEGWSKVPDQETYGNAFKIQWELFLRHVVLDEPFPWNLLHGAKGVQMAELGLQSWQGRKWVEVPPLAPKV